MAEDVQLLVEPVEDAALVMEDVREVVARHRQVVELLGDPAPRKLVVGGPELFGRKQDERSRFRATVFDPTTGAADAYGVADLWFLRYHPDELEDGVVVGGTPAQTQTHLDQFVNGESIDGTDVVVWYAGHFRHDEHAPSPHQGHIVGPELRPVRWS
jgi:Cu2+-containing amine oxidase